MIPSILSLPKTQPKDFSEAIIQNDSLRTQLESLHATALIYEEQLRSFKRSLFGKKSERWISPEEQMCFVFNEPEECVQNADQIESSSIEEETTTVDGYERKKGTGRKPLPKNLPREIVKIELPESELMTEDGRLKIIGWDISEKLKYEPAKAWVVEYHTAKYGLDSGDYIKKAPPVPSVIPKSIATPELLASVVVNKFADGLPLYRQEEIFKRMDVEISRTTLARWIITVANQLQPIWNVLSDKWFESPYVAIDETGIQVLKESGRKAETKSHMIVRTTPGEQCKIVLFDYVPNKNQKVIKDLFEGYCGYVQSDALNIYDILKSPDIIQLGCAMHSRRRFEEATTNGAKEGQSLGEIALAFFKKLYKIEEDARHFSAADRFEYRRNKASPILTEFHTWVEATSLKVPPKSKIGKACSYFLSEYEFLANYLKSGFLEIDNGFTERVIRKFAIGRNNWLFADTVAGAHASSVLYSIVITAKVNKVNPQKALTQILTELPLAQTLEDYERLAKILLTPSD